ncbi:MAG: Lrp/AsnC family transcriptional regulator [Pseudomonadota bacterium]
MNSEERNTELKGLHKRLLNDFQRGFPLSSTPYRDIADRLGVTEEAVLEAFRELSASDIVSRIGPVFPPNRLGVSTLAAMAVPEKRLRETAEKISARPEVNHNYEREHRFNLWFVVAAQDQVRLREVLAEIERDTGCPAMSLPLLEDYFIDLGFELDWNDC